MSTETQKVDVLAVLNTAANEWQVSGHITKARSADAAYEAVAELIEREKARLDALETCERWFAMHSPTAPLINGMGEAEHPMLTMLRTALARVGGAA